MLSRTPPNEVEERNTEDVQELRRTLLQQQQMIQQLQQNRQSQQNQQFQQNQRSNNPGMAILSEATLSNYLHFSIRDALEAVPNFDGNNISFVYFVEGCEEALSMVTPSQELNLVRAVRNKLKGDAHRSILGRTFSCMQELVEFLRTKYGPRETVYEAQGRLAYLCQKKDEKVVAYANRVRELGKRILDAQRRENGEISAEVRNSVEKHLKTSFLRGLNKDIVIIKEGTFEEVESRAIEAEKELETINMIRRVVLAENAPERRAAIRRVGVEPVTCQYCSKKGHTADKCWQINKPSYKPKVEDQRKPNFPSNNVNNINKQSFPNNRIPNNQNRVATITCRYCKKLGHTLEECRKRIHNNNVRQNIQRQGNEQIPARTGATPGNTKIRPTRAIMAEAESDTEQ